MDKNHISVWGRNFEEYDKMFWFNNLNKTIKIISVADGPSAFNLQGRANGFDITSVDPTYNLTNEELRETFKKSYAFNELLFKENTDKFSLKGDEEINQILAKRQHTFNLFLQDYEQNRRYYQYGKLPQLDYPSQSFDLCLCSNFLFMFDHIFDVDFHIASITEMLRIAKEVRLFLLYNTDGIESYCLKPVLDFLNEKNLTWEIIDNDYHVWKNGNRFLKINI